MGFESGKGGGFTIEEGAIGPFRTEERAERKAASIRRAIERSEWDEEGDRPDGVTVIPLNRTRLAAREAVVLHLVHDMDT
jgi:hypothetical protein